MTTFKFIRPSNILDAGGSFTRSTTATYFDIDGVMQTAAIDVPRIGYDPVTHVHTGLILEAAAENLLTYSGQFDNAAWVKTRASITANATTAPDGTTTAEKAVEDSSVSLSHIPYRRTYTSIVSTYTHSVFVKSAERSAFMLLALRGDGGANYSADFDLTGETATSRATSMAGSASITEVGSGWFRCSITYTDTTGGASAYVDLRMSDSPSSSSTTGDGYTGDGTSGMYIWGGQLEVGATATSYIPTTTAAVTRGADTATGSGLIYTDVPEADYPAWVGGTTYTADTDYVIRTTATTHKIYLCLVTHTTAATPEDNLTGATPKWLEISPTNRWKIFDQKVGTTTTQADSMTYLLKPGRANSLALLGVDASSVEVSLVADGETVYTASFDLDSGNSVGDWYEYFYEPIYQTDSVVVTNLLDTTLFDLPQYGDGVLCVRFLRDGGDVTCGVLVAGAYAELGQTLSDPTIGIIDYSRKSTDDFGNTTIVARTYSKRMTCSMLVASSSVDNVSRVLAQYRSTPVVWVAADNIFTSMIVYGFYKDWEVRIESPNHSTCNIQIEGLT